MRKELTKGIYKPQGMYVLEIELVLDSLNEKIEIKADTGFNGGIFLPESYSEKFDEYNINGYPSKMVLADGDIVWGWEYLANIRRIGEYRCDIPCIVHCYGNGIPLMGLELLNRWICEFDGPNNCLTILTDDIR